jgi:hypothetical protein
MKGVVHLSLVHIVESGVKHQNPNPKTLAIKKKLEITIYRINNNRIQNTEENIQRGD